MPVILEWEKMDGVDSYRIERSDTGAASTFTEIVTGLPGLQYKDDTGERDKFYLISGVDKFGEDRSPSPVQPSAIYDQKLVCKIFGEILDNTGRPETDGLIRFEVRSEDAPQVVQNTLVTRDMRTVETNEFGTFEIYLLRDLLVEMFIQVSQTQILFMVPDEDEKNITELAPEFGFKTKITNPF
jgi:hypothetical protein